MAIEFARFTPEEQKQVDAIVDRARRMLRDRGVKPPTRLELSMDLAAVHADSPLRLRELAEADDFNFSHDVGGIRRHLNRSTGRLEDHFLPRFTHPDPPVRPAGHGTEEA